MQAPITLQPGTTIKHYELIRPLGAGGMGTVFLARDTRLGRLVAVKFLLEHSGSAAQRFLAEARATARCRHEGIVVIYDVDEAGDHPYMVLEYIEGQTLRALLAQRRSSTVGSESPGVAAAAAVFAVEVMIPVARALACAHEMGIVHRDLKPENILVTDGGQVKVVDFGIAKRVAPQLSTTVAAAQALQAESALTQDGALVGTMPYMSPEQWLGEPIDERTDIWAAGVILYELLVGSHPLEPISIPKLTQVRALDTPMPSARERCPGAGALADVIDRCLKKRIKERLGSAREFLEALEPLKPERVAVSLRSDESPFAGLAAFQESDAPRFFGRDGDISAVLARLRNQRLVAMAGPSGAGKSSFVRAGVIPALKRSNKWTEAFILRPGQRPLASLAEVLARALDTTGAAGASNEADLDVLASTLRSQPGYLGAQLRKRCRKRGDDHRIVLFVDQLEELYTLGIEPAERAAFCACIEGVADDASSPLRVVLAVRADFLDRLTEDRRFMGEVTRGLVFLPPIGRDGLRDALRSPLDAAGARFEDDALVDEMLDALAETPGPLPLLQFTATKLWEARDRERRLLTREGYRDLGGVAGALSTHADAVLAGLSAHEQRLARSVLMRLVTPERTRAIVRMDELIALADDGGVEHVVQRLADARLLLIDSSTERDGKTIEIVHESLIDRWARLRKWLDEDEQDAPFLAQLRNAAQQWQKNGEAEGLLWRDRAALDAGQWLERRRSEQGGPGGSGLGKREERYLQAVVALAERHRRWRWRIAAGVIASLSTIATLVSVLAFIAHDEARHARDEATRADEQARRADEQARQARNAARIAAAREHQGDPTTALSLLREVEPPGVPRGWADVARSALYGGVARMVLTHPESVTHAIWSPDGKRIVTTSGKSARIWNADRTGEPLVLRGHEDKVSSAAWSPDGKRILTSSEDKTARVWNADGTGAAIVLRGHEAVVWQGAWSPDGKRIVTASSDKTARVWSADGSGEAVVLRGQAPVLSAAFSPDGKRVATASRDGTARLWNVNGGGEPIVLRGHENWILSVVWSPDGKRIVTASWDKTARVWNADGTGDPIVLRGHEDYIRSAVWSPDGRCIFTASDDRTARVWNADGTGEPIVLRGHEATIWEGTWSPDGKRVVTASDDKTARVWRADGTGAPLVLRGHDNRVLAATWSPNGKRIITASGDRTARVWDADGTGEPLILHGHDSWVDSVAWSPDGTRIVSAAGDKTARVWSLDGTGAPLVLRGHEDWVSSAAFSPDGRRVVTASADKTARVWSADGTGEPIVLRGHEDIVRSANWNPNGTRIVTGSEDMTARVWNADGTGEALILRGHKGLVLSAVFSPDGGHIVTASGDKTARVWSADGTGEPIVLRGHEDAVRPAAWSPDGTRIVTGSEDMTARVWSADGTGEPTILRGYERAVWGVAWSPDGTRIVTASRDKTVRVWSADGKGEPLILRGSPDLFTMAAFSPDGKRIAAGSDDHTVLIWSDLDPLHGTADPRLWTATTYCIPVERRVILLGISEDAARSDQEACLRHVAEACTATPP